IVTPLVTSAPVAVFCVFRKGESKASQPVAVSQTTCLYTFKPGWQGMEQNVPVQNPGHSSNVVSSRRVKQSWVVMFTPTPTCTEEPVVEPTKKALGWAPTKDQLCVTVPPLGVMVEV